MSETALVAKIRKALQSRGVYVAKMHGSQYMTAGLPDLWCVVAGRLVCLEVKLASEQPTQKQIVEMERLRRAGATTCVVRSVDDAIKAMGF